MQSKEQQIPEQLLECIQQKTFAQLSTQEAEMVLQYCTAKEYDDMHHSFLLLSQKSPKQPSYKNNLLKQSLQKRYDAQYPQQGKQALKLWRAAAIVLFCSTLGLGFYKKTLREQTVVAARVHDTIYSNKIATVAAQPIHDTLYIAAQPTQKNTQHQSPMVKVKPTKRAVQNLAPDQLAIVAVQTINQGSNQSKYQSIKEDPIVQDFHFVSL